MKFGFVSPCLCFTKDVAKRLSIKSFAFIDIMREYLVNMGITCVDDYEKEIVLPALKLANTKYADDEIMLFDMQTLTYKRATKQIKKHFKIVGLLIDEQELGQSLTLMERTLFGEYCAQIAKIADFTLECSHYNFEDNKNFMEALT